MTVNRYRVELNEDKVNVLVKDDSQWYLSDGPMNSPEKIVELVNSLYNMRNLAEEFTYMLALDYRSNVLGTFEISHGCVNCSIIQPREMFIRALLCGASSIILVHNHPSGDVSPSKDDITVTERVAEAGKLLGIPLMDHIIVGDSFFSFKSEKYLQ